MDIRTAYLLIDKIFFLSKIIYLGQILLNVRFHHFYMCGVVINYFQRTEKLLYPSQLGWIIQARLNFQKANQGETTISYRLVIFSIQ